MKSRVELAVSVLRLLLSEIHNLEIEKRGPLTDDETAALFLRSVKRHEDSVAQFRKGGREDLAAKEESELQIIRSYLPPALTEAELQTLVRGVIAQAEAQGSANLGAVMKILAPAVKGRASGQAVSELVKKELGRAV